MPRGLVRIPNRGFEVTEADIQSGLAHQFVRFSSDSDLAATPQDLSLSFFETSEGDIAHQLEVLDPNVKRFSDTADTAPYTPRLKTLDEILSGTGAEIEAFVSGIVDGIIAETGDTRIIKSTTNIASIVTMLQSEAAMRAVSQFFDRQGGRARDSIKSILLSFIVIEQELMEAGKPPTAEQKEAIETARKYIENFLSHLREIGIPVDVPIPDLESMVIFTDSEILRKNHFTGCTSIFYPFIAILSDLTKADTVEAIVHETLHAMFGHFNFSRQLKEGFTQYMTLKILAFNGVNPMATSYLPFVEAVSDFVNFVLEGNMLPVYAAFFLGKMMGGFGTNRFKIASAFEVKDHVFYKLMERSNDPAFIRSFVIYAAYSYILKLLEQDPQNLTSYAKQISVMRKFVEDFELRLY